MANKHTSLSALFTAIADKIRTKTGSTDEIVADNFPEAIDEILTPTDGTIPTKTSANLVTDGAKVTVPAGYYATDVEKSIASGTMGQPAFSKNGNIITATAKPSASGYLTTSDSNSNTYTIETGNYTVIPSYFPYVVNPPSGQYISKVTVNADANLKAENIKSGVSIFGVDGSYESVRQYATSCFNIFRSGLNEFTMIFSDIVDINYRTDTMSGFVILYTGIGSFVLLFNDFTYSDSFTSTSTCSFIVNNTNWSIPVTSAEGGYGLVFDCSGFFDDDMPMYLSSYVCNIFC